LPNIDLYKSPVFAIFVTLTTQEKVYTNFQGKNNNFYCVIPLAGKIILKKRG